MDDITLSEIDEAIWHAYLARDHATADLFLDLRLELVAAGARPALTLVGDTGPEVARPFDHGADWAV